MTKNNKAAKIGVCLIAELLIIVLAVMFISLFFGKYSSNLKTTTEFENGVPSKKLYSLPVTVKNNGKYVLSGNWGENNFDVTPSYITGFVFRGPDNSIKTAFTAGIIEFDMPIELQKGTYTAEYHIISDVASYNEFVGKYEIKNANSPLEVLPNIMAKEGFSGSLDMEYDIGIDKPDFFYGISGVVIGVLAMTPIILALFILISTDGELKSKLDERQEKVNGKAAVIGFCVAGVEMVLLAMYEMIVDTSGVRLPIQNGVIVYVLAFIAFCVYVTYNILHDGYFALNANKPLVIIIQAVIAVVCLAIGGYYIAKGEVIVNGIYTYKGIFTICGVMLLYLFVIYLIKYIADKRGENA